MEGLEPSRSKGSTDFKSVASTNSATTPLELFLLFIKKQKNLDTEFNFYVKNFKLNRRFLLRCKWRIKKKKKLSFFFYRHLTFKLRDTKVFLCFPCSQEVRTSQKSPKELRHFSVLKLHFKRKYYRDLKFTYAPHVLPLALPSLRKREGKNEQKFSIPFTSLFFSLGEGQRIKVSKFLIPSFQIVFVKFYLFKKKKKNKKSQKKRMLWANDGI